MKSDSYNEMYSLEENNWWYKSRRELVLKLLEKNTKQKNKIIDFGCGTGKILETLHEKGYFCYGTDDSETAINFCKKRGVNATLLNSRADKKSMASDFDTALLLDVLEHVKNEKEVLNQIKKRVKKNGLFIVTVPAFNWLFSTEDIVYQHYRRYTKKETVMLLKSNGFLIEHAFYWGGFLFPLTATVKILLKLKKKPKESQLELLPEFFNSLALAVMRIENWFHARNIHLPFGTSVLVIARMK